MRNSIKTALALAAALLCWQPDPVWPCTTFLMNQEGVDLVGKSYDWDTSDGLVIINKRGVAKQALSLSAADAPAEWVSQYASVTFNQYGFEFPNGGMNEAGLVVEIMWLSSTQYPDRDERRTVNELQWIQHALDNYATVDELIAAAAGLRISKVYAEVHYLACDQSGKCAAFEYLGGELVVTTGGDMPVKTLTNDTYASSAAYLAEHQGFGGDAPIPDSNSSLARFVRASALALTEPTATAPASAFAILDSVSQGSYSPWNIVYLLDEGRVYFRTYSSPTQKRVDLAGFELDCYADVMILDIDDPGSGDVSGSFQPYTYGANFDLLDRTLPSLGEGLPAGALEILSGYPDAQRCTLSPPDPPEEGGSCAVTGFSETSAGLPALLLLAAWFWRRRRH